MRKSLAVFVVLLSFALLTACGGNVVNQVKSIVDSNNEYVQMVKTGHLEAYPEKALGELFEQFFGNPTWTYFEGEAGEHVVEFTGDMMYLETEVKALLQILVSGETFEFGALSFNDVPQDELVKDAVLTAVLEESGIVVEEVDETIIQDIEFGYVDELFIGIGDTMDYVISRHGMPLETDVYGGSYYLRYENFTVFNDTIESEYSGNVSAISVHNGSIFGITINDSIEQVYNSLGQPHAQYYTEEGNYVYEYYFGDFVLELGAETADSPISYIYYY